MGVAFNSSGFAPGIFAATSTRGSTGCLICADTVNGAVPTATVARRIHTREAIGFLRSGEKLRFGPGGRAKVRASHAGKSSRWLPGGTQVTRETDARGVAASAERESIAPCGTRSAAGMVLGVQFFHALPGHVRVNLRRRKVAVPEQHLHDAQVRAVIEQVRREGMPERVRRQL